MDTPVELIVGLGNPGPDYHRTRHNAGADLVFELARQAGTSLSPDKKFFGEAARIALGNRTVHLLYPTTFMNRSGKAIAAMAQFYKIAPEAILVAHDELDLEPGVARLKIGGGHGGHNGLRDTISALGNNKNFGRIRIGIGHPGHASQVTGHVLKRAGTDEQTLIDAAIDRAIDVLPLIAKGEWNKAMHQLHTK
ncbi:aminoacyl-tRNA hydrolase [Gilvimarinus algae]|uniref:Peptidyl-tRNA hydrolase n=1 Tax=Gilvimarinus algae TaxID=3058037 RepID=A0ABT8TCZ4_9GAMM|nr:aminoacyl-tRNA hydrolase [Gilvimarinus sp. SDUM040014]MDO3381982.1 aminoacyl-tRNA hydrolase [Gilvimarinus sp. SDUM040014]